MPAIRRTNITDISPPPGLEIVEWFGLVQAEGDSYETALSALRKTAGETAGANWIIQLRMQAMPDTVFASGIAVRMVSAA